MLSKLIKPGYALVGHEHFICDLIINYKLMKAYYNHIKLMKYQRMDKNMMAALRAAALLIRFRTTKPSKKGYKFATYKTIASILNLTQNEVQHICRKALKPQKILTNKQLSRILDQ